MNSTNKYLAPSEGFLGEGASQGVLKSGQNVEGRDKGMNLMDCCVCGRGYCLVSAHRSICCGGDGNLLDL